MNAGQDALTTVSATRRARLADYLGLEANDDAQKLARGLRAALDRVNIAKAQAK